jgi:hypothetical protein
MIVDCPADRSLDDVSAAIREEWPRTDFGYRHIEIKAITDDGWLVRSELKTCQRCKR